MKRHLLSLLLLQALALPALAEDQTATAVAPLPEPLSLTDALDAVEDSHPVLEKALAQRDLAQASLERARSGDDLKIDLLLEARKIDPSDNAIDQEEDDSRGVLTAHKTLYDFGRTGNARRAAQQQLDGSDAAAELAKQNHRQTVFNRFFEVLIADIESARATEAMALSFVQLDNLRERHSLGEVAEVDLLALENDYQANRLTAQRATNEQQQARARLALALGRPAELSAYLETPELPGLKNELPDYDELLEEARKNNLTLQIMRAHLESHEFSRKSAAAERLPKLFVQLEASRYEREFGSRDPLAATLGLNVPIYQGERVNASVGDAVARKRMALADLTSAEYALAEEVLSTLQTIRTLTNQLEQAEIQADFRELYLDRSRAQYELEIKTDLGDAMVAQTEARRFSAQTTLDLALAREKLATLTQNPAYSALRASTATAEENP